MEHYGVVRRGRPVRTAGYRGLHRHRRLPERREDAPFVDERRAFGRDVDRLWHERIAARVRLGRRRSLARLLQHGAFVDADERLPRRAVENVDPAGLARLRDAHAKLTVDPEVEEHGRRGHVVVPDVVVDMLEMPAVLPGLHVDGNRRHREQIVAFAHDAVVVGTGITGSKIQEPKLRIDGRRVPDGCPAVLPEVVVLRPRLVAELTGTRDRVKGPDERAVLRVERLDAAANTAL